MNLTKIYFAGDSFTYGEGLELYTPTNKWKSELYKYNPWPELEKKLDSDSTKFRTKNNFVGIFSENFPNVTTYQSTINGGSLSDVIYNRIPNAIEVIGDIDIIVIQFSTFLRNPLHLKYDCKCDWCLATNCGSTGMISTTLRDGKNRLIALKDSTLNQFCKIIDFYDIDSYDILLKYDEFLNTSIKNQIEIFKKDFLKNIINSNTKVFFIDSWCKLTSNHLQDDELIRNLTIPLISLDGNPYNRWGQFQHQFDNPTINHMYPNTSNFHPTPEVHRYIGNSLVEFFKDKLK